MVDDDGLDDLVDVGLAGDLVLAVWCGHERGAEAYGQVVRVHHVLVTVLGQAGEKKKGQKRTRHWGQYFRQWMLITYSKTQDGFNGLCLETYWLRKAKR